MFRTTRRLFIQGALATIASLADFPSCLSQPRRSRPERAETVVIVGAGLAGLFAAHQLRQASCKVIVLEARGLPGGRIRTIRDVFDDGLYAEAGASRISDSHALTLKCAQDLGLNLIPYRPIGMQSLFVNGGSRFGSAEQCDLANSSLSLKPTERALTAAGLLDHYVSDVLDEIANPDPDADTYKLWQTYDRLTWPAWLRSRGASEDAIRLITLGGDSGELSSLYVLRQIALHRGSSPYYKILGGMDLLPQAMASLLADSIRYNSSVIRIEHNSRNSAVTYLENGRVHILHADRVVLAIPLPLIRRIEIHPQLSDVKQLAIERVPYFSAARIVLQTRSRFWLRAGQSGFARTDRPAEISDQAYGQAGDHGIVAASVGGRIGRSLLQRSAGDCIKCGVEVVADAFPEIGSEFEKGTSVQWKQERWSNGAFAAFKPGQMTSMMTDIARPEGRLHFAGEHTSAWMGWMEGALRSGDRVAREVLNGG